MKDFLYKLFNKCINFITVEKYKLNFLLASIVSHLNCSVAADVILLKTAKKGLGLGPHGN